MEGSDVSICENDTATLSIAIAGGLPPYDILWSTGDTVLQIQVPGFSQPVEVSVTDHCQTTRTDTIWVHGLTVPKARMEDLTELDCYGDTIGAIRVSGEGGIGPFLFEWDNGQEGDFMDQLPGGWHSLSIQNGYKCVSDTAFYIPELTPLEAVTQYEDVRCYGEQNGHVVIEGIGGTSPYMYKIDEDPFQLIPQFHQLKAGHYELTVQDVNGCEWTKAITIEQPPILEVQLQKTNTLQLGESFDLFANYTDPYPSPIEITWEPEICDQCLEATVRPALSTIYRIMVRDTNGCRAEDEIKITVDRTELFFVPNVFSPNGDGNNDFFRIYAGEGVRIIKNFEIFSRWGERVFSAANFSSLNPQGVWNGTYGGQSLQAGVFIYTGILVLIDGTEIPFSGTITLLN